MEMIGNYETKIELHFKVQSVIGFGDFSRFKTVHNFLLLPVLILDIDHGIFKVLLCYQLATYQDFKVMLVVRATGMNSYKYQSPAQRIVMDNDDCELNINTKSYFIKGYKMFALI